jgi:hypothetical protein
MLKHEYKKVYTEYIQKSKMEKNVNNKVRIYKKKQVESLDDVYAS